MCIEHSMQHIDLRTWNVFKFLLGMTGYKVDDKVENSRKGPIHAQIFCQIILYQIIWQEFDREWSILTASNV